MDTQTEEWGNAIMKKIVVLSILAVVAVANIAGFTYGSRVSRYRNAVAAIDYSGVDISAVADGVYPGECDVGFISAKVAVTVEDGAITHIDLLEHKNDRGGAATGIGQRIVREQRVDVDVVTGATNSSKVIKKAVDNALSGAG